jgi:hypothetical protein
MTDRAHIEPLKGKYYGTIVLFKSGCEMYETKLWYPDGSDPSDRQLEDWGMTLEEAKADLMTSDNHYETKLTYQAAKALCDWLNVRTSA